MPSLRMKLIRKFNVKHEKTNEENENWEIRGLGRYLKCTGIL
jgi:hypothetical protein